MEENRLKPMTQGYDESLFNLIYDKTKHLRRKLASEIDHRRFGVTNEDIKSWFDVKLIYVFKKRLNTKIFLTKILIFI